MILLTFTPFSAILIARILMKSYHFPCRFLTDFKYKGAKSMYKPIDNVTFATVNRWENGCALPNMLAQDKIYDL